MNGQPLICYAVTLGVDEKEWKVYIPTELLKDTIHGYHLILGHPGKTKLYDSTRTLFYYSAMKNRIDEYHYDHCQRHKLQGRSYGHLPARGAILLPFEEVNIDLIGLLKVELEGGREIEINALTCIELVTNLVEIIKIENKTAEHVAQQFENCWLSRYP